MVTQQLTFEATEKINIESNIHNLFERFAITSFFNLQHFEIVPNFRKSAIIGYSINIDKVLVAKINIDLTEIIASKKIITSLGVTIPPDIKELKNPKGFYKNNFENSQSGLIFLEHVIQNYIENYIPSERFGCCHRYVECSDAMKCTAPDKFHARGCYYRENLEKGKIFYGKNANI